MKVLITTVSALLPACAAWIVSIACGVAFAAAAGAPVQITMLDAGPLVIGTAVVAGVNSLALLGAVMTHRAGHARRAR